MLARTLEANVRHEPAAVVVELHGEISGLSEEELYAAYTRATLEQPSVVLLNFTGVDYINSTGLALIVGLVAKARQSRMQVMACGLSEHYREIFRITRLVDFIGVYTDEVAALGHVQGDTVQ